MSQSLISLETAHAHLRLGDDTSLDSLVVDYLEMAVGIADDYTNRHLASEFTSENLPPAIKAALLLILGTLLDNESDVVVGRSVAPLPLTAEKLLQPWRIHPYSMPETSEEPEPTPDEDGFITAQRIVRYKPDSDV